MDNFERMVTLRNREDTLRRAGIVQQSEESVAVGNICSTVWALIDRSECDHAIEQYAMNMGISIKESQRIIYAAMEARYKAGGPFGCSCRPDEYSMCAARVCPNSCDWPDEEGHY